jgi:hypothetical protein
MCCGPRGRTTPPKAIQPIVDRMDLLGVRTGVTDGVEGDEVAKRIMEYSNFASGLKDALEFTFSMSESYLMVCRRRRIRRIGHR